MKFKTERLQVASYLHASQLLKLIGVEEARPGRSVFVFADPNNEGDEHEFKFNSGAQVSALALFASQTFLRRAMTQRTESQKPGAYKNDRTNHFATR